MEHCWSKDAEIGEKKQFLATTCLLIYIFIRTVSTRALLKDLWSIESWAEQENKQFLNHFININWLSTPFQFYAESHS